MKQLWQIYIRVSEKDVDFVSGHLDSFTDALSIFVWKTIADPFAGRITLFRVASGSLESDASVYNISRETILLKLN